ncbi:hypothetical protein BH20ACT11_BH20ACT11_11260 [soil metagenome]
MEYDEDKMDEAVLTLLWMNAFAEKVGNTKAWRDPSTALRLAKAFGTSPECWLNGQLASDLYRAAPDEAEIEHRERIESIEPLIG